MTIISEWQEYNHEVGTGELLLTGERMIVARFRRSSRFRLFRIFAVLVLLWNIFEVLQVHRSLCSSEAAVASNLAVKQERIYISSIHWNNEIILRSHWNAAVLALCKALGPENIYVSIYESGSYDDTKGALRTLDEELGQIGVHRSIVLDETSHAEEIANPPATTGWIRTPRGKAELRRIPYLARLRNLSLKPLETLAAAGERFDKLLFLNDVVFTVQDVLTLLSTNDNQYGAACALDFSKPPNFYDTFALRDVEGNEPLMQRWPYFRSRASRHAVKQGMPVPMASCWNGAIVMDARPFYEEPSPLRFRAIPDSLAQFHLEGSECCLIHADNPLSPSKGIWLNPSVRVGYNGPAYDVIHHECGGVSPYSIFTGLWTNRLRRWLIPTWTKSRIVARRLHAWAANDPDINQELGTFCLINEMQVLDARGWLHV